MGIFEQFPYTNFHDLNLDWILHAIRSMDKKLDEFVASNVLSYADPIQWDIETQYAKNTVVVDPKTGTAYMSINPVPVGQLLTNKYYWQPIFNYDEIVNTLKKQIAAVQADQHDIIHVSVGRGDLVWVANKLYRLTKSLDAGSKITENENAVPITVEDAIINIDTTKNITRNTDGTITDTAGTITRNSDSIIDTANDAISVSGKTITNVAADSITNSSTNITETASDGIARNADTITDTATGDVSVSGKNITDTASAGIARNAATITDTATGDVTVSGENITETASAGIARNSATITDTATGDVSVSGGNITETASAGITRNAVTITDTATGDVSVSGKDITLTASDAINFNSTNPIKYSIPTKLNDYVGTIPMTGTDGNEYKLLTAGELAKNIGSGAYINVKAYGCKGDGITDDSKAIQDIINNNAGRTIYFPKGIYLVNEGIKLIDHTNILGDGFESVIKANANNIIVLYNDKYTDNIGKDNHEIGMVDITISNILIDGNRQEIAHEPTSTTIKEGTQGIGIYGGGIRMDKVMVTNCGKCGVHTGWNSYWSGANSSIDTGESVFSRCVIKWNGEEGWIYEGPHDSMLTNSVIASNSRNNHNVYDNMLVSNRGNLRITACHFYSDYGLPKAKSGLHIDSNAYQCNIDNCHIEGGASESLIIETPNNQISNCNIYACFGDADVLITSDMQWFANCIMSEPARGEGVTSPDWVGALRIDGNRRNITGDIILNNTPLYITKPNLSLAHFNLKGSGNSNYIGGRAVPEDYPDNSTYYDILGEFADQSQLHYIPSNEWRCNSGLPETINYKSFNLNGDDNLYSRFGFVWGYTSGTLYLSEPSHGSIMIIGNATPSSVPIKCRGTGNKINNHDTDILAPQSTTIFFGESNNSWLKV